MGIKRGKTPEEILGISTNASAEEVKNAYRSLARQYHPDVSKDEHAEEKFKELEGAVTALKNRANLRGLLDFDLNNFEVDLTQPSESRVIANFGKVNLVEQRFTFSKKKPRLGSG